MSKVKSKRCKIEKTDVFLDFKNVVAIMGKRGVVKNQKDIAKEVGFSTVSVGQWSRQAPEVVSMIYHFLKDNHLKFEDLVKECTV